MGSPKTTERHCTRVAKQQGRNGRHGRHPRCRAHPQWRVVGGIVEFEAGNQQDTRWKYQVHVRGFEVEARLRLVGLIGYRNVSKLKASDLVREQLTDTAAQAAQFQQRRQTR